MKHLLLIVLSITFISNSIFSQTPENANDIAPLLVGEQIPEINLKTINGADESILSIIHKKPTVILFYRGGWCPYCNTHLAEIQDIETDIIDLGYQIIAISPDSPKNLMVSDEKIKLNYNLYSDADGKLCNAMGIAFKAPERHGPRLFESSEGLNNGFLPVPSIFITDTSGQILFEYINPNYKKRMSGKLLLAVLKNLD